MNMKRLKKGIKVKASGAATTFAPKSRSAPTILNAHPTTELIQRIEERKWSDVIHRCRNHPHEVGYDSRSRNDRGYTALHVLLTTNNQNSAATTGEELVPVIKAILRAADKVDYGGATDAAADYDDDDESRLRGREMAGSWRLLLDQENKVRWSPLHLTCVHGGMRVGKIAIVKALLQMDEPNKDATISEEEVKRYQQQALALLDWQDRNLLHHLLSDLVSSSHQLHDDVNFLIAACPGLLFQKDSKGNTPLAYVLEYLLELEYAGKDDDESLLRNNYAILSLLVRGMERETRGCNQEECNENNNNASFRKNTLLASKVDNKARRNISIVANGNGGEGENQMRKNTLLASKVYSKGRRNVSILAQDNDVADRGEEKQMRKNALLASKVDNKARRNMSIFAEDNNEDEGNADDGEENRTSQNTTLEFARLIPPQFCPSRGSLLTYLSSENATKMEASVFEGNENNGTAARIKAPSLVKRKGKKLSTVAKKFLSDRFAHGRMTIDVDSLQHVKPVVTSETTPLTRFDSSARKSLVSARSVRRISGSNQPTASTGGSSSSSGNKSKSALPGSSSVTVPKILRVIAPPGKLGIVLVDTLPTGGPATAYVNEIFDASPIRDQIRLNDKIIAVDDEHVQSMTALDLSIMLASKGAQKERKLMILREVVVGRSDDVDAVGEGPDSAMGDIPESNPTQTSVTILHVTVPPGELGIVLDTSPAGGPACVREILDSSPIIGQIRLNDKIIAVGKKDVREMTAMDLSTLLGSKIEQRKERKLMILREIVDENEDDDEDENTNSNRVSDNRTREEHELNAAGSIGGPAYVSEVIGHVHLHDETVAVDDRRVLKLTEAYLCSLTKGVPENNPTLTRIAILRVIAPEGKLGIILDTPPTGGPAYVSAIFDTCPIIGHIHLNDKIIAVDDLVVWESTAIKLSELLGSKKEQKERTLIVCRDVRDGGYRATTNSDPSGEANGTNATKISETKIDIVAPAGKLGVVLDSRPEVGPAWVSEIKDYCPIRCKIHLGDKIVAVDDDDVRDMLAAEVSTALAKTDQNPERKITVVRTDFDGNNCGGVCGGGKPDNPASNDASTSASDDDSSSFSQDNNGKLTHGTAPEGVLDDASTSSSVDDSPTSSQENNGKLTYISAPEGMLDMVVDEIIDIIAPPGMLGVILDSDSEDGPAYVSKIKENSPLRGKIRMWDEILAIDGRDVSRMNAVDLSMFLSSKGDKEKEFTIWREGGNMVESEIYRDPTVVRDPTIVHRITSGRIDIIAPAGELGIVLDSPPEGGPAYVSNIENNSPIGNKLQPGDKIMAIDGYDVSKSNAADVSTLLASKSSNKRRRITIKSGEAEPGVFGWFNNFIASETNNFRT